MTVRPAAVADAAAMQDVGAAAGERFRTIADPRIAQCADDPPIAVAVLRSAVDDGRALVAVDDDDRVLGFLVWELVDGCAHVEEVSVHPDAEGRGHGTALLDAVAAAAVADGRPAVTLTTFGDVPWNRPFYERRGYRVLSDAELTPGLRAKVAAEADHGLDPEIRVVMRRELPT